MVILDTLLGLCICKFDSERVSASPATNLTARHCVVKSFNRYVRGKRVFSQTTYIPLDVPPSDGAAQPAPVPSFPGHEAQADQTVDVKG